MDKEEKKSKIVEMELWDHLWIMVLPYSQIIWIEK